VDQSFWLGVLTFCVGAFVAFTSYRFATKARKDKDLQDRVALKVASDKAELDATQQALDAYERLNVTHQREIDRMVESASGYRDLLASERKHARDERVAHAALVERYRTALMDLLEALMTLKNLVPPADVKAVEQAMIDATQALKPQPEPEG
jgi:hypothetical protein